MRRSPSALVITSFVAACSASIPPPAVAPPPAPAVTAPEARAAEPPATPVTAAPAAAMRTVRQPRFTLRVPEGAPEVSPGRWDFGADPGGPPHGVGVSSAPFRGTADDFVRQEFGRNALTDRVTADLHDQAGAQGWRAWDVTVPGSRTTGALHARFLTHGARTAFAICVHNTRRPAQEVFCRRALDTLRTGRASARSTTEPGYATFAENEVALDLPSTWRRLAGESAQFNAGATATEGEQDITVFMGTNEQSNNLSAVMEGSLAASRARPNTTVEVRERRTRRVNGETEGSFALTSTEQVLSQRVIGRASARDGWAWAVICITPENRPTGTCATSVASFEALR
jgi:hypothetical protein